MLEIPEGDEIGLAKLLHLKFMFQERNVRTVSLGKGRAAVYHDAVEAEGLQVVADARERGEGNVGEVVVVEIPLRLK